MLLSPIHFGSPHNEIPHLVMKEPVNGANLPTLRSQLRFIKYALMRTCTKNMKIAGLAINSPTKPMYMIIYTHISSTRTHIYIRYKAEATEASMQEISPVH